MEVLAVKNSHKVLQLGRRRFMALAGIPLVFPSVLSGCAVAQEPSAPYITPEMLGWTEQTDPVETAAIINRALATAAEKGITYYDNAKRRIAGTIRLGGQVVMEFGSLHNWLAVTSDMSRFDAIELRDNDPDRATTKHVFVDTAGARGSILRGPMMLNGGNISDMSLAGRSRIPASLVALTSSRAVPSAEISIESITIQGFGYGLFQGAQIGARPKNLPYTRLRVGTAIFRFCGTAIETGQAGNGLDDATFQILRISRCANGVILRGTDLNAMSVFDFGLREGKDAEPGQVTLTAGSDEATFTGAQPEAGMVVAVIEGRDRPGFVARVDEVSGGIAFLSHTPQYSHSGQYIANPPSSFIQGSALNSMHFYIEGVHDMPLALRNRGKLSIQDLKVSGGSFTARGGTPISVHGQQTSMDVALNPRAVDNRMLVGLVGMMTDDAQVAGRVVSGGNLGTGNGSVIDTRPFSQGRARSQPSSSLQGFYADRSEPLVVRRAP